MVQASPRSVTSEPNPLHHSGVGASPWSPAPDSLGWFRVTLLVVWGGASFGTLYFAQSLQHWAGVWPLTFWLAAQGVVLVFVMIVFVYAMLANRGERVQTVLEPRHDELG